MAVKAWTIGGQMVRIDARTQVDEQGGSATVGATATVYAIRLEDGGLLALEIKVEQAAQPTAQPLEFQGLIDSFGPAEWVVAGRRIIITADTSIENAPRIGLLAEVKALQKADGTVVATYILVRLPTEVVQFEGLIQAVSGSEWTVEGVSVHLDAQTSVQGTPVVGALAEVEGLLLPDNTVLAGRIVVQPLATPTLASQSAEGSLSA
jgi:hypothetical protein